MWSAPSLGYPGNRGRYAAGSLWRELWSQCLWTWGGYHNTQRPKDSTTTLICFTHQYSRWNTSVSRCSMNKQEVAGPRKSGRCELPLSPADSWITKETYCSNMTIFKGWCGHLLILGRGVLLGFLAHFSRQHLYVGWLDDDVSSDGILSKIGSNTTE